MSINIKRNQLKRVVIVGGGVNAKARMDYNKIPEEQLQLIEDVVLNR